MMCRTKGRDGEVTPHIGQSKMGWRITMVANRASESPLRTVSHGSQPICA